MNYEDFVKELMSNNNISSDTKDYIADMHNELCFKCGKYNEEHLGSCDGCKFHW